MYCNFCGKNFDTQEGSEDVVVGGHHLVRCDKCSYTNEQVEFDWRIQMYGRGQRATTRHLKQRSRD